MTHTTARPPVKATGRMRDLVILVDRGVYHLTRHWVAFINVLLLLYIAPAFLGPYLMSVGDSGAARIFYRIYAPPVCHQLPERSFFLFGPKVAYAYDELVNGGMRPDRFDVARPKFAGSPALGYKMVFCERDLAIYGGLVVFGMIYALAGRGRVKTLPIWGFALLLLPIFVDGTTQLVGWRESTAELRVITGVITAAASIWFAYPYIETAMIDLRLQVVRKLHLAE